MSQSSSNRRLAKNTLALYMRSIIVMVVGLYTSRVVLQALGAEDYGLYNVVGSVVVLFSFLNGAMTTSVQRFLTYEIGRNDELGASNVFSASMGVQIILSLVLLLIVEFFGIWFINAKLNIPLERMTAANWVFQLSVITFCIGFVRVPYEATVIAHEKMTFFAYVSIFDAIMKLLIVFLLSLSNFDKLITYALLMGLEHILVWQIYRFYCKKKFRTCKFVIVKDHKLYKKLLSFSGWSLFGSATNIVTQKGFVFLVNIYYGLAVNAALGIANQVNAAVFNFVSSFSSSYRPQIVKSYAQGEQSRLFELISMTSRLSYSLMALPILLLIFNMPLVLNIWLKDVPLYTMQFCQIILVCSLIDAITIPYNAAIMATAKIKKYQLWISFSYVLDILVSYIFIRLGVLPYLVLFSRILTRGLFNAVIGLVFVSKLIDYPVFVYLRKCIFPILITLLIMLPVLLVLYNFMDGFKMLLWSTLFSIVVGLPSICFLLLTKSERCKIYNVVEHKILRK